MIAVISEAIAATSGKIAGTFVLTVTT
jgi:hypothetical protein